jgi:glycerophosphoryl diester phosphodiesterase
MSQRSRLIAHLAPHPFVIIGHRGAAGLAPENTLASFSRALDFATPMVELDVHRVPNGPQDKEDVLVVIHDDDVRRTTNGKGRVSDFDAAGLATLDAGNGERIPTLTDVIALIDQYNQTAVAQVGINIELKGQRTASAAAELLNAGMPFPTLVSSFDHDELRQFHHLAPTSPVAPLFDKWQNACFDIADELAAVAVNWSNRIVSSARVNAAKNRGLKVFVYTVNHSSRARELEAMGVDGIFTDRPDRMRAWLPQA